MVTFQARKKEGHYENYQVNTVQGEYRESRERGEVHGKREVAFWMESLTKIPRGGGEGPSSPSALYAFDTVSVF